MWIESMTVLVLAPRYAPIPGGIERLLGHVLPALQRKGHELVVATGTDGPERTELIEGVPVYRLPFGRTLESGQPGEILRLASRLRDIEVTHGVDARHIHGFGDSGLWFVIRDHQRRPCPLAVTVHGTVDQLPNFDLVARALRSADVISVVSDAVWSSVTAALPGVEDRVRLIPNALPSPAVSPRPWTRGPLLAIGRLEDQKGFDVALDALALLGGSCSDAVLQIVGMGSRHAMLRDRAGQLGIAHRVTFVDHLSPDGITAALNDASIVLVPARTMEGFSLVALEAAQMARPVIGSRVGGIAQTVEDGVTGTIVAPEDPAALAAAIEALLDDPSAARAMSRAARARAARFDFPACVDAYDRLYEALYAHAQPAAVAAEGSHG